MNGLLLGAMLFLSALSVVSIIRAYIGPTPADRIIAINLMTTLVVSIILLLSFYFAEESFVDVAILYAMIGFLMTVAVVKYLRQGSLK